MFKTNRNTDRHTIVTMSLRQGRFLVLVFISLAAAFTYAAATKTKLVLTEVYANGMGPTAAVFLSHVKLELSNYNALFGTIMFAGSKVFEVYNETFIFPTLHTYLHNCSLYPGDEPQRVHSKVKANAIFWGLKALVIFMNVGFASLYVGQSSVKIAKAPGTRRLATSAEMDTLWASDASWRDATAAAGASETDVLDTVLRSAMVGSTTPGLADDHGCASKSSRVSVHDLDTASVAYGFASHDWSADVLRHGVEPQHSLRFTISEFARQQSTIERDAAELFQDDAFVGIAHELLEQGVAVVSASLGRAPPQTESVLSLKSVVEQTVTHLSASLPIQERQVSATELTFAVLEISEDVSIFTMTVDVPVATAGNGSVLCGARTAECVYSHALDARLQPEISILPYAGATRERESDAAFVFGLGRSFRASAASGSSLPQEIVSLSFGRMTWRAAPLHVRHETECADKGQCLGLSVPVSSKRGVVLVSADALPTDYRSATPSHPLRLVTVHPVAIPDSRSGRLVTWSRVAGLNGANDASAQAVCTGGLVDVFLSHLRANRLVLEKPLQAMYTSALLYLVQNGVFTEYADMAAAATSRKLALAAEEARVDIEIAIPESSSIATFAGCGVMVLLTVFVIFFPTDRVKLSPNTTPAAQYVQILTDDLYPDIVHKKRLRFINGDGLLFNEYVVDSIVLHAKINEKKKIHL